MNISEGKVWAYWGAGFLILAVLFIASQQAGIYAAVIVLLLLLANMYQSIWGGGQN